MRYQIKIVLNYMLAPKAIIFGLALFNFVLIWTEVTSMRGIACVVCPWYHDWSYNNEPSLLLIAASFLLLDRGWSYLASIVLSGFVLVKAAYLITLTGWMNWLDYLIKQWKNVQENDLIKEILLQWEMQLILAIIIFSATAFYLLRNICKRTFPDALDKISASALR